MPLRRHYDYVIGENFGQVEFLPGTRVSVPFGRRKDQVGMVLGVVDQSPLQPDQLKSVSKVIDYEPLFSPRHFELLCWAADYYHYPVGEVLFSTLPGLLRKGKSVERGYDEIFRVSAEGRKTDPGNNAPAQIALLRIFAHLSGRINPAGTENQTDPVRQTAESAA